MKPTKYIPGKTKYVPKPPPAKAGPAAVLQKQQQPLQKAEVAAQKMASQKKRKIKELATVFINGKAAGLHSPQTKKFQKEGMFFCVWDFCRNDRTKNT